MFFNIIRYVDLYAPTLMPINPCTDNHGRAAVVLKLLMTLH